MDEFSTLNGESVVPYQKFKDSGEETQSPLHHHPVGCNCSTHALEKLYVAMLASTANNTKKKRKKVSTEKNFGTEDNSSQSGSPKSAGTPPHSPTSSHRADEIDEDLQDLEAGPEEAEDNEADPNPIMEEVKNPSMATIGAGFVAEVLTGSGSMYFVAPPINMLTPYFKLPQSLKKNTSLNLTIFSFIVASPLVTAMAFSAAFCHATFNLVNTYFDLLENKGKKIIINGKPYGDTDLTVVPRQKKYLPNYGQATLLFFDFLIHAAENVNTSLEVINLLNIDPATKAGLYAALIPLALFSRIFELIRCHVAIQEHNALQDGKKINPSLARIDELSWYARFLDYFAQNEKILAITPYLDLPFCVSDLTISLGMIISGFLQKPVQNKDLNISYESLYIAVVFALAIGLGSLEAQYKINDVNRHNAKKSSSTAVAEESAESSEQQGLLIELKNIYSTWLKLPGMSGFSSACYLLRAASEFGSALGLTLNSLCQLKDYAQSSVGLSLLMMGVFFKLADFHSANVSINKWGSIHNNATKAASCWAALPCGRKSPNQPPDDVKEELHNVVSPLSDYQ